MSACTCNVSLSNTGQPGCFPVEGVAFKLILVAMEQADGTANEIDLANDTLDSSYISGLINNTDDNARWFPVGNFKNVVIERADPITQEFDDGSVFKIRDGVKSFTGVIPKQTADLKRKLDSWSCTTFGAYIVTKDGQLIGDGGTADKLKPIKIEAGSFDARYVHTTDTTVPQLQLNFQWVTDFSDSDLRMLEASDWTSGDLTTITGLVDLFYDVLDSPSPTATGFTVDITTDYGSVKNRTGIDGLDLVTDFEVVGSSSGSTAIATSTEDSTVAGRYAITFTTLTGEDVYVQKKSATTGYNDFTTETVTLP